MTALPKGVRGAVFEIASRYAPVYADTAGEVDLEALREHVGEAWPVEDRLTYDAAVENEYRALVAYLVAEWERHSTSLPAQLHQRMKGVRVEGRQQRAMWAYLDADGAWRRKWRVLLTHGDIKRTLPHWEREARGHVRKVGWARRQVRAFEQLGLGEDARVMDLGETAA